MVIVNVRRLSQLSDTVAGSARALDETAQGLEDLRSGPALTVPDLVAVTALSFLSSALARVLGPKGGIHRHRRRTGHRRRGPDVAGPVHEGGRAASG